MNCFSIEEEEREVSLNLFKSDLLTMILAYKAFLILIPFF